MIYGVHEVYYDDENYQISFWSVNPIVLYADSYETLKAMKDRYLLAYAKPVLIESELLKDIKKVQEPEINENIERTKETENEPKKFILDDW